MGEATPAAGSALTRVAEQVGEFQGDFIVDARVCCPGVWTTGGVERHAEQLFTIQADVWKNSLATVTLETYRDAWLTMDTRGREQLAIHAENSPRLTLVLKQISALLVVQPTPGDENRYATPTDSGFEDVRVEGLRTSTLGGPSKCPHELGGFGSDCLRRRVNTRMSPMAPLPISPYRTTVGESWAMYGRRKRATRLDSNLEPQPARSHSKRDASGFNGCVTHMLSASPHRRFSTGSSAGRL